MKKTYENFSCRIFPGFYESNLYNSDTLNYYDSESLPESFCWEFVDGGFARFEKETCGAWVSEMQDSFEENPLNMQIGSYKKMWSPRWYNFETDRIQLDVNVNMNELKKYCWNTVREEFNTYLHEHWSSCDGFISFIPNNVRWFESEYKQGKDKDTLQDIMIEFYLLKFINFEDVEMDVLESNWERIHNNVTLQDTKDWSLWDYEWNQDTEKYVPTTKIA